MCCLKYEMVSVWYEFWYTSIQSLCFYKWLWILNWSKWILVADILTQILLTLLTLLPYYQFCEKCGFLVNGLSLWYELLCNLSIYTMKTDQWITIQWAKSELECLLLIFICFNSNFKFTLQKWRLGMPVNQNSFRRKNITKNCIITFTILHFSHQNALIKSSPWVLWKLLFLMKVSDMLQDGSICQKKKCKI